MADELRLEPSGVVGRELSEELALNSSELRLSEPSPSPSLRPLLMELLSSQLKQHNNDKTSKWAHKKSVVKWIIKVQTMLVQTKRQPSVFYKCPLEVTTLLKQAGNFNMATAAPMLLS